ncbi:alpha/beta hydrolase [Oceanicaulis sp. LC35]|uniref:alpha/beta hydrolase n=1 Tax=Oceanicaulis sp. LC35 TaxID=3349635 RepID=UPI003F870EDA
MLTVTSALWAALSLAQADVPPPFDWRAYPVCTEVEAYTPTPGSLQAQQKATALLACQTPIDDLTVAEVDEALAGEAFALAPDLQTGALTVLARSETEETLSVSGTLNMPLTPVGAGRFAARLRLERMEEAMVHLILSADLDDETAPSLDWRGPNAPAIAARVEMLDGHIEHHEVYSPVHGETRRVHVYLPPDHDTASGPYPVVFMTDGAETEHFAHQIEAAIKAGELAPLILVGALSGPAGVVEDRSDFPTDLRAADYLIGWYQDENRAEQHLAFFTDTLTDWASAQFGASTDRTQRAVLGFSNGASFARHAGYLRGDVFGWVMAYSSGYGRLRSVEAFDLPHARFRFAAGRYEPGFKLSTELTHGLLSEAGYDTRLTVFSTGHTRDVRDVALAAWLAEAFPQDAS